MNPAVFLVLAFGVEAPGPKDPPRKDAGLVGEWVVEALSAKGEAARTPADGTIFEFTADGEWIIRLGGRVVPKLSRYFKEDPKAKPATFDVYLKPPATNPDLLPNMLGIYKVEADTLTIVFGASRPTEFAAPADGRGQIVTLKRAKKD